VIRHQHAAAAASQPVRNTTLNQVVRNRNTTARNNDEPSHPQERARTLGSSPPWGAVPLGALQLPESHAREFSFQCPHTKDTQLGVALHQRCSAHHLYRCKGCRLGRAPVLLRLPQVRRYRVAPNPAAAPALRPSQGGSALPSKERTNGARPQTDTPAHVGSSCSGSRVAPRWGRCSGDQGQAEDPICKVLALSWMWHFDARARGKLDSDQS